MRVAFGTGHGVKKRFDLPERGDGLGLLQCLSFQHLNFSTACVLYPAAKLP